MEISKHIGIGKTVALLFIGIVCFGLFILTTASLQAADLNREKEKFQRIDTDNDGSISLLEMQAEELRQGKPSGGRFQQTDTSMDGQISWEEFLAHEEQKFTQNRQIQGPQREQPQRRPQGQQGGYSIDQAISDEAQLKTISFAALAYLTGDFCSDTFLPPGKVSDFFGFQYMRDIDAGGMGHNTDFVPRSANNVLYILTDVQIDKLIHLAQQQVDDINLFARNRFPLMSAFRRHLSETRSGNTSVLSEPVVIQYSSDLYALDGNLSAQRAMVLGNIIQNMSASQKGYLDDLAIGNSNNWPRRRDQVDKRKFSHSVHVAIMTYASELLSWYKGSVEADTYFTPERHGMYFGAFYMKDMPAMGNPNYTISTSLTADKGQAFLTLLTSSQRELITQLVKMQSDALNQIVQVRRQISIQLRKSMTQPSVDATLVERYSRRYGELDGYISYLYATHFSRLKRTLTPDQEKQMMALRNLEGYPCRGAYEFSRKISQPYIGTIDCFF
ncbi:MAG: hypothetical protein GY699_04005 [Desulfobacteraceae bacterium]|nr:hypothetical protein [Desulfobacteraceae bacterium]